MKKLIFKVFILALFLFVGAKAISQDIQKYDYLEIIVIQKANNSGKIKRIKVREQRSLVGKIITIDDIEDIKGTSDLLNYMNAANWEFVDRKAVTEEHDPVWMSYIFRKKKEVN
jgi:hypothetical protein